MDNKINTNKMRKMCMGLKSRNLEEKLHISKNSTVGLHSAIRNTLLCCRVMGLFPLSGLTRPLSDQLKFSLWSPYTIIYVISIFGQCLMFFTSFYWLLQRGISLTNITNSLFYFSSLTSLIILMTNIGRHWPKVIMRAEELESNLPPFSRDVTRLCNITMVCILLAALVEHFLSVAYGLTVAYSCSPNNIAETYFRYNMPWIFDYIPFTLWKGIISEMFNIQSTFIWSLNDLLVMVISIYLTEHFVRHNELLERAVYQDHFSAYIFRKQYLKIVRLVKLINGHVGIYILTSFGSNLYWICTQLFFCLNKTKTGHFIACKNDYARSFIHHTHTVYFTYSFSFLVARTLLVLLLAARIHSNSSAPLLTLYSLPSDKFNIEVERFIAQIKNIKVALSGLSFFYVTRTMILTLLGNIVTYELVLLQFNNN